jgi:hypothetical protein
MNNNLISSKVTASITSQSLTVTDLQPKETHFDKTNQTKPNPSQVLTNHVRVHATHDREHDCYNSFIIHRGCTHSP